MNMKLSIIIPVYNEDKNITPLSKWILQVLEKIKIKDYEILFIDDGSKDNTFQELVQIHNEYPKIKVIKHRRNFGQTAALSTGFRYATGDTIVTMDGDMQNDPSDIPLLLEKLDRGYDLVCGWRYERKDPFLTKKIPSFIANKVRLLLSKDPVHDSGCSLKAFKGDIMKDIPLLSDAHRFFPAMLQWEGYKIGEVKVKHHPRKEGKTKYGIVRIFRGFFDLIAMLFWYKYSKRPLHLFGGIGFSTILLALFIFLYIIVKTYIILNVKMLVGPLLLFSVTLLIAGLQFILFGFLGEMQAKTYYKANIQKNESIVLISKENEIQS